eukprot:gene15740-660_t
MQNLSVRDTGYRDRGVQSTETGLPCITKGADNVRIVQEPTAEPASELDQMLSEIAPKNPKYLSRLDEHVAAFLDDVTTLMDVESLDSAPENAVVTTSIHQAKGLEWPVVILIRANEGVLPVVSHFKTGKALVTELEEERRLMYVAMTRASTQLYVNFVTASAPSRFLFSIPHDLMTTCPTAKASLDKAMKDTKEADTNDFQKKNRSNRAAYAPRIQNQNQNQPPASTQGRPTQCSTQGPAFQPASSQVSSNQPKKRTLFVGNARVTSQSPSPLQV